MRKLLIAALVIAAPAPAFAYIGPGAGLSLLGALWGLLAAVSVAIMFIVAWPVRKMLRKRRSEAARPARTGARTRSPEHPVAGQGGS